MSGRDSRLLSAVRDVLTLGLCIMCLYLYHFGGGRGGAGQAPISPAAVAALCPKPTPCPECRCAEAETQPPCDCLQCPTPEPLPCPSCPPCGLPNGTGVLSVLQSFPKGVLLPTRPAVYAVTEHPNLVYFSIQADLPFFELLSALQGSPGADGGVVVDVGAGYGSFSLYAARLGKKVLAIEPHSPMLRAIEQSARLNGVAHLLSTDGSYVFESATAVRDEGGRAVRTLSIDTIAGRLGTIYVVRIDTRGYESLVIRSAMTALREGKILHLLVQFRELPEAVLAHHQIGKRAKLRGALELLEAEGWGGRLLRSACSDQMRSKLEADPDAKREVGVEAWHLGPQHHDYFLTTLSHKHLRGSVCPVWFAKR
eukprot:Hpha_TRINITY_DN15699_c2_g2::TRINITY_DN15699_c2_g2_i1::g.98468::m.98468